MASRLLQRLILPPPPPFLSLRAVSESFEILQLKLLTILGFFFSFFTL